MSNQSPADTRGDLLQGVAQELGPEVLETVLLHQIEEQVPLPTKPLPAPPPCITQDPVPQNLVRNEQDWAQIMVGSKAKVPRWKPGSVIKWTAWRMGYDSQEDANYAAYHLSLAAEKWNERDIGVQFEYVPLAKDANFVICHGGDLGGVLAKAFFPNKNDLNFVYVYSTAFAPDWKPSLWKVLTHELGHVLGLRHEFAMRRGEMFEGDAQLIGEANEYSVMNYRTEPPEIQESDIVSTRKFYSMPTGTMINKTPIVDYTPK